MTTILPCPKCREPLEVPRPAPDQLRCNFCGAVIKNTPRKPAEATKVPAAEATAIVEPAAVGTVAARSRNKSAAAAEAWPRRSRLGGGRIGGWDWWSIGGGTWMGG